MIPILILLALFAGDTAALHSDAPVDSISRLLRNARWQTTVTKTYDPTYVAIPYPGGDLSPDRGVCTDVIIRAFRAAGPDLQKLIHEDMVANFAQYPKTWGLKRPDPNIDHRRVANIATFLTRTGRRIAVSDSAKDYLPGDIVTWLLPGDIDHIGLASDSLIQGVDRYAVVHNIGEGARLEDALFRYPITGHFRYFRKRVPGHTGNR